MNAKGGMFDKLRRDDDVEREDYYYVEEDELETFDVH
jgi:hypothetical protein